MCAGARENSRDEREREAAVDSARAGDQSDIRLHSAANARGHCLHLNKRNTAKRSTTATTTTATTTAATADVA